MPELFALYTTIGADIAPLERNVASARRLMLSLKNDFASASNLAISPKINTTELKKLDSSIASIGKNISAGLAGGISGTSSTVTSAISKLATNIINRAKSILGIKSPSTVFAAIGRQIVAGLSAGLSGASGLMSSFFGNLFGNLAANALSSFTQAFVSGGKAILDYSSKLEQTKISFETLMGGSANALKHLQDLQNFALSTPFQFEQLTGLSQRLQGAGIQAEKILPLMRDIGNVVSATGKISEERFEGITVAISQMISKTKVSAEEMEQLAERGVPAWKLLSEATGKSQMELRKLAEQGQLSSDVMVAAFQKISKEKFGDAMEKQSRTFAGAMSNIKDIVLQTSQVIFAPLYEEITKFSVKFADELSKQRPASVSAADKFGLALGNAIADGYRRSQIDFGSLVKGLFTIPGLTDLGVSTGRGFIEGLNKNLSIADLRKLDDTVSQISDTVIKLPSVADKLGIKLAEKQAEALLNQYKGLGEMISNLALQVQFFGDESQVATTKQQLLTQGVYDFNSALAKSAIKISEELDKLKEIKTVSDHLKELRENARFEMSFPNATELDKFESWVKRNVINFAELRGEIEATRRALSIKMSLENVGTYIEGLKSVIEMNETLRRSFDSEIRDMLPQSTDLFIQKLEDFAKGIANARNVTIKDLAVRDGVSMFPQDFANQVNKYVETINTLRSSSIDGSKAIQEFRNYLDNLGTVTLETGEIVRLFTDKALDDFVNKFILLNKVSKTTQLQQGLATLDSTIENLGLTLKTTTGDIIGVKTPLEALNEQLANPANTEAIEKRAKTIGKTSEALKELMRSATLQKSAGEFDLTGLTGTSANFFDGLKAKLADFKASLPSIKESLITNLGDAFSRIGDIFGNAFAQFDGTIKSFFSSVAKGFADLAKQIISELIRILIYKAIFKLIGAFTGGSNASAGEGIGGSPIGGGGSGIGGGSGLPPGLGGRGIGDALRGGMPSFAPQMAFAGGGSSNTVSDNRSNIYNINVSGGNNPQETAMTVSQHIRRLNDRQRAEEIRRR